MLSLFLFSTYCFSFLFQAHPCRALFSPRRGFSKLYLTSPNLHYQSKTYFNLILRSTPNKGYRKKSYILYQNGGVFGSCHCCFLQKHKYIWTNNAIYKHSNIFRHNIPLLSFEWRKKRRKVLKCIKIGIWKIDNRNKFDRCTFDCSCFKDLVDLTKSHRHLKPIILSSFMRILG